MRNRRILGTTLITVILILMGLSIAMIASVSFTEAQKTDSIFRNYHYVVMQAIWFCVGTVLFFITSMFKYTKYKKLKIALYILGIILLMLVPLIGKTVKGAKRWISLGPLNMQPSELAKIIIIIYMASIMDFNRKRKAGSIVSLVRMLVPLLIYAVLIIIERSFSVTAQIIVIGMTMIFVSRVKIRHFLITALLMGGMGIIGVRMASYRMDRILGFLGRGSADASFQAKQSLIAIGSGKMIGKLYGNGQQKYSFLPEIHTDYIFSGYAEETGFMGVLLLIALYAVLMCVIFKALLSVRDYYAKYLLTGILAMISVQVLGNIAVVSDFLPSTGIPLPLLSYGGSNLCTVMASLGIVYNIIKSIPLEEDKEKNDKAREELQEYKNSK